MSTPPSSFDNEADEDLLTMMSWDNEPAICSSACASFYRRHAPFVYKRCCRAYLGNGMNRQDVEDLVSETFIRVRERCATFQSSVEGNADDKRHRVLAWLFAVARRLAMDMFRGRKLAPKLLGEQEKLQTLPQSFTSIPSEQTLIMQRAVVEALDVREREVLLVTMQYYDPEKSHQRLPDDVATDLAKRFNTTTDNIRKIRMRALAKIREYVEAALPASMTAG